MTLSWIATSVALALFLPQELSFYLAGLRFSAVRFILLLAFPVLVGLLFRKMARGEFRFVLADLFVVLTGLWLIFAPGVIDGVDSALNHAGPDVLEFCVAYMTTRVSLRRHGEALKFAELLCRLIVVVALLGFLDSLTNSYFIHGLTRQLTGFAASGDINDWEDAHRLGILRATGPVEHPILFGFICLVGVLIAMNLQMRARAAIIAISALGALFSFSSAPLQGLLLALLLLLYNRVARRLRFRWAALTILAVGAILLTFAISNSPVGFIISHLIYDASSGYYRYWTWERVIFYVSQSPMYGLGYATPPDDINHSIDSLWLVLSVHAGIPGPVLLALSLVGSASLPTSGRSVHLSEAESRLGTILGILIFLTIYIAFTVHLWGSAWILIGLLTGLRAHLGELGRIGPIGQI